MSGSGSGEDTSGAGANGAGMRPLDWANLGHARLGEGDVDGAEQAYVEALAQAEAIGDGPGRVAGWSGLGFVHQARHAYDDAAAAFDTAAGLLDRAGDPIGAAWTRVAGGTASFLGKRHGPARDAYERALAVLRVAAGPDDVAGTLVNLGGILLGAQEALAARAVLDEAADLRTSDSDGSPMEAALHHNRGVAALTLGDFAVARAELDTAQSLRLEDGDIEGAARSLAALSNLHRYKGELEQAIACHERVMALEAEGGFRVEEPGGLLYAGIEDHALHLDVARAGAERTAAGGRMLPEGDTRAEVVDELRAQVGRLAHPPDSAHARGPFVIFAPPVPGTFGPLFPRGATAIASYLNHHGVPAVVVPLSHYVDVYLGEDRAAARTREVIADAVASLKPRAIGISITFSYLYEKGRDIARFARAAAPETPIVIGGPHVTYWDEECLAETPEIDVVVRGEGEWTALDLLRALESGADLTNVGGITWRNADGVIVKNKLRPLGNVLELPPIDFGLMPAALARRMEVSGMTSRGCSFRCRYCHEFRFWGGTVRQYPVMRVVEEMERLARDHGNSMAGIDDSMLSMEDDYFIELCAALGKSEWLPDRFGFLTRVDTITPDGLAAMNRVGLSSMSVGLESGSETVLKAMNKGVTLAQARRGLEMARGAGVSVAGFFIIGHPGDNRDETAATLEWVEGIFGEDLLAWLDVATFTPYPGTPFFAHPEKYGVRILNREWAKWRRSNRPIAELTDYPAGAIYHGYLRMLDVMDRHTKRQAAAPRPARPRAHLSESETSLRIVS